MEALRLTMIQVLSLQIGDSFAEKGWIYGDHVELCTRTLFQA